MFRWKHRAVTAPGLMLALAAAGLLVGVGVGHATPPPYSLLYTFDASHPERGEFIRGLTVGSDGTLYGVAEEGGNAACIEGEGCGTVFALKPDKSGTPKKFEMIHVFSIGTPNDGAIPEYAPTLDADGNLFGTTLFGGNGCDDALFGCGVIYEDVAPAKSGGSWKHKIIHAFTSDSDGALPEGPLLYDKKAGVFYGTTCAGGDNLDGTFFTLVPKSDGKGYKEKILYSFPGGKNGACPFGALATDKFGIFYGVTSEGGTNGVGVVYRLEKSGGAWHEKVLHPFAQSTSDVSEPVSGIFLDKSGVLVGVGFSGGAHNDGAAFTLTPNGSSWTFALVHSFSIASDGEFLEGVALDKAGNVHGVMESGGSNDQGTLFELTKSGASYNFSVLYNFCQAAACADGESPLAVTVASDGTIYGAVDLPQDEAIFQLLPPP